MENAVTRFNRLYPNREDLNLLLDRVDREHEVRGANGMYIRRMGDSRSKAGCITYYVSNERLVVTITDTIFKVRRCADRSIEFKEFSGREWLPYGAIPLRRSRRRSRSGFVGMPRNATRRRARNMGYPPEFFIRHFGSVPYTNRRFGNRTNAPLTRVGQNLENRERIIKSFPAGLANFNRKRAALGYYNRVGATPTRSRSRSRSRRRSRSRSRSGSSRSY